MKVAMIYDFAVNKGGGDFVMLNILESLSSSGYEVTLFTSYPRGLYEAAELFDKPIPNVDVRYIKVSSFLRHPYTIAYIAYKVSRSMGDAYDVYLVSDDIPKSFINRKGICYMHYPHAARLKFREYVASKYKTTFYGRILWKLHEVLFPRYFLNDTRPKEWLLIANSMVTRLHSAKVFHVDIDDIVLLNPPVAARRINESWRISSLKKEDLVVCVGRFELEKRFVDVLQALPRLRKKGINVKLSLIGFAYDERHLIKVIKAYRLEEVELLVNAKREVLIERLLRAKAIVHPTPHEPFGIAVVEGMAAGCIPIVRRGFNGPWLEIVERGKYGFGFSSSEELAEVMKRAIESYEKFNIEAIIEKALTFDELEFRRKFLKIFERFMFA